jgi:hypothetical protein
MMQEITGSPFSSEEKQRAKDFQFFGYEIIDKNDAPDNEKASSFVPPLEESESAIVTTAGAVFGHGIDVRGDHFVNDRDLIVKYRNAAMNPEVDRAIDEIVNEVVVANDEDQPVTLNLDHIDEMEKGVKKKIQEEFEHILNLIDFRKYGHDIIRRWYVDGRIAYHNVIDLNNPKRGVIEMRPINPLKIQRIKEVVEEQDPRSGAKMIAGWDEYFVYSDDGFVANNNSQQTGGSGGGQAVQGLKIAKDAVSYVTSGQMDPSRRFSLSHLHTSLRYINQLRMMEDALVIYRLSRAPERRIFYVDIGDMPKAQGQKYLASIMQKYRNKLSYDPETGTTKQDRRHMHMLEDFWLPRQNGKGTEVSNLPGGQNLGEIEDIIYFKREMLKSMKVPYSRMDSIEGSAFNLGRASEIDRDEVRFQKFIDSLRIKFSDLFRQALRSHLILKNVLKENEWDKIKDRIIFDYARDNFFSELKEAEILRERIETLNSASEHIGTYYSKEYVRKHILHQTEEEIREIKDQIRAEALNNDGLPNPERDDVEGFGGGEGGGGAEGGFEGDLGLDSEGGEFGGDEFGDDLGDPEGAATELGADAEEGEDLGDEEDEFDLENENQ